jgi:hypothetical protein
MGKFLMKLIMFVKIVKVALRIATTILEVAEHLTDKLSEQHAV